MGCISRAHTHSMHKRQTDLLGDPGLDLHRKQMKHFGITPGGNLYVSKIDKLEIGSHLDFSLLRVKQFTLTKVNGPLAQCHFAKVSNYYSTGQEEHYKSNTTNF